MPATLAEILVPVGASLATALIAGVVSYVAGRGVRFHEWRLGLVRERLLERQRLYARFLAEADRNQLAVVAKGEKSIDNLAPLLSAFGEISLLSSDEVAESARIVCETALSSIGPNAEKADGHFQAKAAFIDAARAELAALESGARKRAP